MKKIILFLCLQLFTVSFTVFAENVYLNNGKILPGTITSSDTEFVNLKTEYGEIQIERKDVVKIEYSKSEEKKKARKFAIGGELNPYSFYGSSLPLWGAGIRYIPFNAVSLRILFGALYNSMSIYGFCGYPITLSVNPEVRIFIEGGAAYQYSHYQSWNSTNYDYSSASALAGISGEYFPLSYLPNLGYSFDAGLTFTWFPSGYYSYYSSSQSFLTGYYLGAGIFYYIF